VRAERGNGDFWDEDLFHLEDAGVVIHLHRNVRRQRVAFSISTLVIASAE
jgi:hypothetical protein